MGVRAPMALAALAVATATVACSATDEDGDPAPMAVQVELTAQLGPISPLVRGLSGGVDADDLVDMGITVNSWGGNPATRFNYMIGHAWNAGADYEFRNGNYGQTGDVAADFITESRSAGAAVRLAVPTLGWVAKDDDDGTCSFPTPTGCDGAADHDCANPGPPADPARANVPSTPAMVQGWITDLAADGLAPELIAMDNEPELWGRTHYDVHPTCTTYEEVLERYLNYATAIRDVAPDAQLLGPVACCWFDYWNAAPGPADGGDDEYLTWFLTRVREHDEQAGRRTLDLLDVHYYPQGDIYNETVDADTAARRLRSTRSLWDPTYVDESWIDEPIRFIPRMRETIEAAYPGTGLAVSEWNFGADTSINGALAIADVLGIFGREGVAMASYWRHPPLDSPGSFAFKMYGNYDDAGSSFDGTAVAATTPDIDRVSAYAAVDDAGLVRVMLVNKTDEDIVMPIEVTGGPVAETATVHQYAADDPTRIVSVAPVTRDGLTVELAASSITLVEVPPSSS